MIPLDPPNFGFAAILDNLPGGPEIAKVHAKRAVLEQSQIEYLEAGPVPALHGLSTSDPSLTADDETAMKYAYAKFASKRDGGRARPFYYLLESSSGDRCPLCLQSPIAALDHYLPKSPFARLAIMPANLIPICHRCNSLKLNAYATAADDLPLHPYFDRIGGMDWLAADLLEVSGAPVQYRVESLPDWDDLKTRRVTKHFRDLGLNGLWQSSAASYLVANSGYLRSVHGTAGAVAVRETLNGLADSYESVEMEPWRVVAMRLWAASDWFCDGGWDLAA